MSNVFVITTEREDEESGHNILINGQVAYWRPYDGSREYEVVEEAAEALGALLRGMLGHPKEKPHNQNECPDCHYGYGRCEL